jgi:hypothetical protein
MDKRTVISTPLSPIVEVVTKGKTKILFNTVPLGRGMPRYLTNFIMVLHKLTRWKLLSQSGGGLEYIELRSREDVQQIKEIMRPLVAEVVRVLKSRSNWRGV